MRDPRGMHAWLDALRTLLNFHISPIGLAESSVARKRSQSMTFHVSCTHCEDMMFIHIDLWKAKSDKLEDISDKNNKLSWA